jgi:uroporphyrinogen-III synthase
MTDTQSALSGSRVLIPRGGDLGDRLAAEVNRHGGEPVIAPVIEFREPVDARPLVDAFERLSAGGFDWVAVTSATAVPVLVSHGVTLPRATRVAVVGPATGSAMGAAGFRVDFMPTTDFSAAAMVAEWPETGPGRVLLPQSAIAEPTLENGLRARGLAVTAVTAYETTPVEWSPGIRHQVSAGDFAVVFLTSASVARGIAAQGGVPQSPERPTLVVCIGESTAAGARAAGLPVHAIADRSTAESLVTAAVTARHQSTFDS